MSFQSIVQFETLRSLAYTSISGSYAAIGTPLSHPIRTICFINNTNGDMFVSDDGVNNKIFVARNSYKLYDLNSNRDGGDNREFKYQKNTQFYVKQSSAPSSGDFYMEVSFASGE